MMRLITLLCFSEALFSITGCHSPVEPAEDRRATEMTERQQANGRMNTGSALKNVASIIVYDIDPSYCMEDIDAHLQDVAHSSAPALVAVLSQLERIEGNGFWKGGYFAVARLSDGSEIRLSIGIMTPYVKKLDGPCYLIPKHLRKEYFATLKQITFGTFVPKRKEQLRANEHR